MMTPEFLPPPLKPLYFLALDLKGSSSAAADTLWSQVNPLLWSSTRNPWLILQTLSEEKIEELTSNLSFCDFLQKEEKRQESLNEKKSWFDEHHKDKGVKQIAYFSMEFGLSEALPIYSGGLGMLAGDHLKASSDLGVPITGLGLLYQQGYFRQTIDAKGEQLEFFPCNTPSQLPIRRVLNQKKRPLFLSLSFPGRSLFLKVWKVKVGRVWLYLLDSNDLRNTPSDRGITGELYEGKKERRLQQELVLAWGGSSLLTALNANPDLYHLNEGHAAFVVLENCAKEIERKKVSFKEALTSFRKKHLFTTHTPVSAGFDRFDPSLISHYFQDSLPRLGLSLEELLALGRIDSDDPKEPFNMAFLAAKGSEKINGVSRIHGEVSRTLFAPLFPKMPKEEIPIGHITNGVHIPSWESPQTDQLWEEVCGEKRWQDDLSCLKRDFSSISNSRLWELRNTNRAHLIQYVRLRLETQLMSAGCDPEGLYPCNEILDPHVLTIGFSRRFAPYKRVDLLLTDQERLISLLECEKRPIQLLIAGKAHPSDEEGKALVKKWVSFIRQQKVRPHAVFLSDYDILLAERLVQGVDLWVNTPRFPWEASGTSGMKVLVNGGLNLSELDGWWAEAYSSDVGWALGDQKIHKDEKKWDAKEADDLYVLLEKEILPLFYERDENDLPQKWLSKVKKSMETLTPRFSANRMVREYVETYYLP